MSKAWSISTTVRNPERLRAFLVALRPLVGKEWTKETQEAYQKLLIKNRLYGYGSQQFYNGLPYEIVALINDVDQVIDDAIVDTIVEIKNYRDFPIRGRQSINPLTKFGFALIDNGVLKITELGEQLIASEKDYGDVFLRSFIKWQIPNPASNDYAEDGEYDIVPFVATLKLIHEVNRLVTERGDKPVGISKREFGLFVPTLINHGEIMQRAQALVALRYQLKDEPNKQARKVTRDAYGQIFATHFLGGGTQTEIDKLLGNLGDYGDNAIRYFRLTKFIRIRGNGFFIDLEPSRHTEIEALLEAEFYKPKAFADKQEYLAYMSDINLPKLPWQTADKLVEIAQTIQAEVGALQTSLNGTAAGAHDVASMDEAGLIAYIETLRKTRTDLQERDNHVKAQPIEAISSYIEQLEGIYTAENRPLKLEYLSTMGLHALNDAKEIKPNYPVGDDNEPTSTAPGGMADIECFYEDFNMICEVTMLNGRDQWFNEGQPVMRHLRSFEDVHQNAYCLFVAPSIHTDTAETFWFANTQTYKGAKQRIAPITIKQFIFILKTLKGLRQAGKPFGRHDLKRLLDAIVTGASATNDSDKWVQGTEQIVQAWATQLV